MTDSYKTIKSLSKGLYKEKGSKFIGIGYPVSCEEEIKSIIGSVKKEYYDARHHCYAYQIGLIKKQYRVNDDGEPSGTAGNPIYNQIISNDLTNILIIVIRYFGGKLLGIPGLVHAYKSAAEDVINNAEIVFRNIEKELRIRFPYSLTNPIMKIIKDHSISITEEKYDIECELKISIKTSLYQPVCSKLQNLKELKLIRD